MSGSGTAPFFSGWIGFGTGGSGNPVMEPVDSAYVRRPILYGPLAGRTAPDISSGSVGPAMVAWPPLTTAGLFNQPSGGNLLAWWSLQRPVLIAIGATFTTANQFGLTLTTAPLSSDAPLVWWAGTLVGRTACGNPILAAQNLQVTSGVLSQLPSTAGGALSLTSLPTIAPASGSGVVWNNGGVICVA